MTKLCHKMWIKEICILVKFQSQTPSGLGVIELLDGLREWIFAGIKLCDFAKGKSDFFGFWKLPVRQNFKKFDFAITLFHELKKRNFVRIELIVLRIWQKFAKSQNFILAIIYSLKVQSWPNHL